MRIVLTGSSGRLGSILYRRLTAQNHQVAGMGRRTSVPFDLSTAREPGGAWKAVLSGADILVHVAWDLETLPLERRCEVNVEGSRELFAVARSAGVRRIVFLSTTLARADSRSQYGISKRTVEEMLNPAADLVLRVGWVLGTPAVGGFLRPILRYCPLVPWGGTGNESIYWVEREAFENEVPAAILGHDVGMTYVMRGQALYPDAFLGKILERGKPTIIPLRSDWFAPVARALGASYQRLDSLQDLRPIHIENSTRVIP